MHFADPRHWVQGATRTLFVGNLEPEIMPSSLRDVFEPFSPILSIDIKPQKGPFAYAFVKFPSVAMATTAKQALNGKVVGRSPIKIGFGKVMCPWFSGLCPNTTLGLCHCLCLDSRLERSPYDP